MSTVKQVIGRSGRSTRRWARNQKNATIRTIKKHRRPAVPSACWAPHSALYFRPDGILQSCCATGFEVGSVSGYERMTLREVWEGERLAEQRRRLQADRFDLGCQECEVAIQAGGRESSLASHFDRWRLKAPYEYPKLLDFALSSRCNLMCVMCNGELSSSIRVKREGRAPMAPGYDDQFFEELAEFLPHAQRIQFKGGEPFLAKENKRVWDMLIEQGTTAEITITTNGTVWNDDVERYFRALRAEPNVSVDGMTPEVFESIRVGADFDKVWANIDRFQAVGREIGRELTLSYCFMTTNWHQLPEFLLDVERRGVSCYVILVNQPDEYDVLKLPKAEIQQMIETLEQRAPALTASRPLEEWGRVLDRLRSHLEHPISWSVNVVEQQSVPVAISSRPPLDPDEVRRQLSETAGAPVAEIVAHHQTVVEANGPAWARPLALERWVGATAGDMLALLESIVGAAPQIAFTDDPSPGVSEVLVTWRTPSDAPELRVWIFRARRGATDPGGAPTERWLIAPRALDAPADGGSPLGSAAAG